MNTQKENIKKSIDELYEKTKTKIENDRATPSDVFDEGVNVLNRFLTIIHMSKDMDMKKLVFDLMIELSVRGIAVVADHIEESDVDDFLSAINSRVLETLKRASVVLS